uniref:Putative secreted protein n=1 Tax=Anopheles triannulatus TaxID=58253 RepID=A0A2M4B0J0_9DIPT
MKFSIPCGHPIIALTPRLVLSLTMYLRSSSFSSTLFGNLLIRCSLLVNPLITWYCNALILGSNELLHLI